MAKLLSFLFGSYIIYNKTKTLFDSKSIDKNKDENKKMTLEFLNAEYKNVNDRLAGYSEADQKIIAVAATVIVAALGFALTKYTPENEKSFPYVFFLSAGFINLAVIQSVLYSSLALFALERKVRLTLRIEALLGIPVTDTTVSTFAFNLKYKGSYIISVFPYYTFKSLAGGILFSFAYIYKGMDLGDKLYMTAFTVSAFSSIISFVVVWFNAFEQIRFSQKFLAKHKRLESDNS